MRLKTSVWVEFCLILLFKYIIVKQKPYYLFYFHPLDPNIVVSIYGVIGYSTTEVVSTLHSVNIVHTVSRSFLQSQSWLPSSGGLPRTALLLCEP